MHITLNGEHRQVADASTLGELLSTLDLGDRRFAVEVNEELVPRSTLGEHRLCPDDRVEIVQAIGGG